jgi:alpha-L-fucosidase
VGRGASFLLSLAPDRRGLLHENDLHQLAGFRNRLEAAFDRDLAQSSSVTASHIRGNDDLFSPQNLIDNNSKTYWSTDDGVTQAEVVLEFKEAVAFNIVRIREFLPLGQRIEQFSLDIEVGGVWQEIYRGTAIGSQHLARVTDTATHRLRFGIIESPACPAISAISIFYDLEDLLEPDESQFKLPAFGVR